MVFKYTSNYGMWWNSLENLYTGICGLWQNINIAAKLEMCNLICLSLNLPAAYIYVSLVGSNDM